MSSTPQTVDPKEVIRDLMASQGFLSTRDVVAQTGLTRQAVLYHLSRMVSSGEIRRAGAGRGAKYFANAGFVRDYDLQGLEEDRVWREVESTLDPPTLKPNVRSILGYAVTEMVNNAIDHSAGTAVSVKAWRNAEFAFEIIDDGVGAFRTVREKLRLPDNIAAIQELSKGKQTTDPERHSGQGIFFTSKAVDVFQLDSNGTKWVVDNPRRDQAVGESPVRSGTRVRFTLRRDSDRVLRDVFDAFSDAETNEFSKTAPWVRLFTPEGAFVSRSEAKRLAANLDRFREVILDFSGVTEVGQGFVDELFRVWATAHPETKLRVVHANPTVDAMIRRWSSPRFEPG